MRPILPCASTTLDASQALGQPVSRPRTHSPSKTARYADASSSGSCRGSGRPASSSAATSASRRRPPADVTAALSALGSATLARSAITVSTRRPGACARSGHPAKERVADVHAIAHHRRRRAGRSAIRLVQRYDREFRADHDRRPRDQKDHGGEEVPSTSVADIPDRKQDDHQPKQIERCDVGKPGGGQLHERGEHQRIADRQERCQDDRGVKTHRPEARCEPAARGIIGPIAFRSGCREVHQRTPAFSPIELLLGVSAARASLGRRGTLLSHVGASPPARSTPPTRAIGLPRTVGEPRLRPSSGRRGGAMCSECSPDCRHRCRAPGSA